MIVTILKMIFGNLIGLNKIPEDKKDEFWKKLGEYSVTLASEMAEGAARGAASELKSKGK